MTGQRGHCWAGFEAGGQPLVFPGGNRGGAAQAPLGSPAQLQYRAEPGPWLVVPTWPPHACGLASRRTKGPGGVTAILTPVCPVTAQPSPCRLGVATCLVGGTF